MARIQLTEAQIAPVQAGLSELRQEFDQFLTNVQGSVGSVGAPPGQLGEFVGQMASLAKAIADPSGVPSALWPILRAVVQWKRRRRAQQLETFRERTVHPEIFAAIEADLSPLDSLMAAPWFARQEPTPIPRYGDFLTLQRVTEVRPGRARPTPTYEDKFRILFAPSAILPDLAALRDDCELRGAPLSVALLDIDNFKAYNTRYTETRVDRDLLPTFMRVVERVVFGHGRAYRFGGDELVLILPNAPSSVADVLLRQLRDSLANVEYPGIADNPSVSCGVSVVEPDCFLTDREILDRAALAKRAAKESGRNATAGYRGNMFRVEDLVVPWPGAA